MLFRQLTIVDDLGVPPESRVRFEALTQMPIRTFEGVPGSPDDVAGRIGGSDAILVSWRTPLPESVLSACPNLRYIGLAASSFANPAECPVDLSAAARLGIVVAALGQYGDEATAEWVLARMLGAARYDSPRWRGGVELFGKRLGIIGMGNVGAHVAHRAAAFGMEIAYAGPHRKADADAHGWRYVDAEFLLSWSDVVSVHVPKGVVALGGDDFAVLRPDCLLINTSLGPAIEVAGLKNWLRGMGGSFICDASVADDQCALAGEFPTVFVDQRVAGDSAEMRMRKVDQLVANAEACLSGPVIVAGACPRGRELRSEPK